MQVRLLPRQRRPHNKSGLSMIDPKVKTATTGEDEPVKPSPAVTPDEADNTVESADAAAEED